MRFVYLLAAYLPVFAQTAAVSPVIKAPGEILTLEISADSQPARAPVALKWEVVFPAQLMEMEGNAPQLGSAAMDLDKTLQCTARKPYAYVCVLSGGQKPIANGTVAVYRFRIRATAAAGTTALKIEKAEGTTSDSKTWTLNETETVVTIRR
jgi:hypothetical protein